MKRSYLPVVAIVFACLVFGACTQFGELKSFSDMNPKEKATFFMGVYNSQAEDYKLMAANPNLTEDQKKVLREKKKIMVQIYPMIQTYNVYVDNGAVPSVETEQAITNLLNQLTSTVISTVE